MHRHQVIFYEHQPLNFLMMGSSDAKAAISVKKVSGVVVLLPNKWFSSISPFCPVCKFFVMFEIWFANKEQSNTCYKLAPANLDPVT